MCRGMICLVAVLGMRFMTLNLVTALSLDLLIRRVFRMRHFTHIEGIYLPPNHAELVRVLPCELLLS